MPISISSSPRSNDGLPAWTVQAVSATPIERTLALTFGHGQDGVQVVATLGGGADDLLQQDGAGHATASGGPGGILNGHVVVGPRWS